ncbi:esterase family protein [Amycolatopsis acidicola]|uniref:Esterase family protein n=1 Tax=Amycolatopsis acidicola TaxID=2596893 RepID=A0A5N0ULP4_9PSEU|nr:alpha/beta hydrolase family protein [Amycolatopsis acidicola]KAA9148192.1 esterase family protein [Amycolatopsis acidicola]
MIRAAFTVLTTLTAFVAAAALVVAVPAEAAPALPQPDSHGITLVSLSQDESDPRLLDAVVATAAIYQPVHVRIYLPAGYATDVGARYKTLYLLHGGGDALDDARSWVEEGDVPGLVDETGYPGIVVMPEGGKAGWYTDWAQPDYGGRRPLWETFHIDQLVPWIDANFRTLATKADRTIAGLSMGGYGALSYAARHPELFSAAAEFSGTTNLRATDTLTINQLFLSLEFGTALTVAQEGDPSYRARGLQAVFGPFVTWSQRNPFDLADVYRTQQIQVALYVGDGTGQQNYDVVEGLARLHNDLMHLRLRLAGVQDRYCTGVGSHLWPFWQQDLADFLRVSAGTPPAQCPNGWGAPRG